MSGGLVASAVAFSQWREPTWVLTPIGGSPPLAPLYAAFAPKLRLAGLAALPVLGGGLWLLRRPPARTALFLVLAFLFAFSFRYSVHALRSEHWPGREIATYVGEEVIYDVERIESVAGFLGRYTELQPGLSLHGRTKPPGFALFYYGLMHWLGRDLAVLGAVVTLLGSALVIPAYFLGRRLGGATAARGVALLSAAAPSTVLYGAVTLDALFAVVATAGLALALAEEVAPRRIQRVALGLVLYTASMLSYSAALVALLCGAALVISRRESLPRRLAGLAEVALITALPLLLVWAWSGFDAWGSFAAARRLNAAAMSGVTGRDLSGFGVWIYSSLGNLLAFALFLGMPCVAGLTLLRNYDLVGPLAPLAAAFSLALATACFGGLYLMETERILMFLVPPAIALSLRPRDFDPGVALVATGLQTIAFEVVLYTIW